MSLGEDLEEKGEYTDGEWAVQDWVSQSRVDEPVAAGGPVGQTGGLWKVWTGSWGIHAGFILGCAKIEREVWSTGY